MFHHHQNLRSAFRLFLTIFSIAVVTACTIRVEEKQGPLGKEANPSDVGHELSQAIGDATIITATKDQYVVYEGNVRIEQTAVIRKYQKKHTLFDIKEDADEVKYILTEELETFKQDGTTDNIKNSELPPLILDKRTDPSKKSDVMAKAFRMAASIRADDGDEDIYACDGVDVNDGDDVYDCLRYYNLKSKIYLADPPQLVKNKPGCIGLPNCKLTVHFVSFDRVKWRKGKIVSRLTISYEIVQNVPDFNYNFYEDGSSSYYPPVLSFCLAGLTPDSQGYQYYLSQCEVLRDFQ